MPIMTFLWFIQYSVCAPTGRTGQGFIFGYPIYQETKFQIIHVIGTWFWLYGIMIAGEHILNSKFNPRVYDIFIGSSMYVYSSHYFWIVVAANIYLGAKMDTWSNAIIIFITAEAFLFMSYFFVTWLYGKFKSR